MPGMKATGTKTESRTRVMAMIGAVISPIARLVASLPRKQVAVYEDEVDVHLNPKIGLDWMGLGQQKDVLTPGQNEKRYLAGALDVRTREVHWVEAQKKS